MVESVGVKVTRFVGIVWFVAIHGLSRRSNTGKSILFMERRGQHVRGHASAGGGRMPAGAESELSGLQSLAASSRLKYIIINDDDDDSDSNNGEDDGNL